MADSDVPAGQSRGWWLRGFERIDRRARYSLREQVRNATVAGLLIVVVCRLAAQYSLDAGLSVAYGGVGFVVGVAVVAIATMLLASWHTRIPNGQTSALVASLLVAAAGLCVWVEANAAAATLLREQGLVGGSGEPSLLAGERFYLWHVADSLPLLHIPATLGWAPPGAFDGRLAGILVLVFKLVLLLPLARLAVAGYRLGQTLRTGRRNRFLHRVGSPLSAGALEWIARHRRRDTTRIVLLLLAGYLLLGALGAVGPGGAAHGRLGARFAASWLVYAVDGVIVVLVLTGIAIARAGSSWPADRFGALSAAAVRAMALIAGTGLVSAAALVTLRRTGVAPTDASGDQVLGALHSMAWHLVAVAPGPNIQTLLDWRATQDLTGPWTGLVVVLARALALVGPLVVLACAAEGYVQRRTALNRAEQRRDEVTVPRAFGRDLVRLHDLLDERDFALAARTPVRRLDTAIETLGRLRHESDQVGDALGENPARLAKEAVSALSNRLFALRFRRSSRTESDSDALRIACLDRINAYGDAARSVLQEAMTEATATVRRWPSMIAQSTGSTMEKTTTPQHRRE